MMEAIKVWLVATIAITIILYAPFSFTYWELNPTEWSVDARGFFSALWVTLVLFATTLKP